MIVKRRRVEALPFTRQFDAVTSTHPPSISMASYHWRASCTLNLFSFFRAFYHLHPTFNQRLNHSITLLSIIVSCSQQPVRSVSEAS